MQFQVETLPRARFCKRVAPIFSKSGVEKSLARDVFWPLRVFDSKFETRVGINFSHMGIIAIKREQTKK